VEYPTVYPASEIDPACEYAEFLMEIADDIFLHPVHVSLPWQNCTVKKGRGFKRASI
jgi:hypothetical protein